MTQVLDNNISTCIVTATYQTSTGMPMGGTVTFTPSPKVILDADSKIVVVPTPITKTLSGSGSISAVLIATDDPDLNPNGWTYTVSESLSYSGNSWNNSYSIEAPQGQTIDLAQVMPVSDFTGVPIYRGTPGGGSGGTGTSGYYSFKSIASSPYAIGTTDQYLSVSSSAPRTINLISAASFGAGKVLIVKDSAGNAATNNITINLSGTDTIDQIYTGFIIDTNFGELRFISNGSGNWELW